MGGVRVAIVIKLIKLLSPSRYYVHISIHLINHNMENMVNNQIYIHVNKNSREPTEIYL